MMLVQILNRKWKQLITSLSLVTQFTYFGHILRNMDTITHFLLTLVTLNRWSICYGQKTWDTFTNQLQGFLITPSKRLLFTELRLEGIHPYSDLNSHRELGIPSRRPVTSCNCLGVLRWERHYNQSPMCGGLVSRDVIRYHLSVMLLTYEQGSPMDQNKKKQASNK